MFNLSGSVPTSGSPRLAGCGVWGVSRECGGWPGYGAFPAFCLVSRCWRASAIPAAVPVSQWCEAMTSSKRDDLMPAEWSSSVTGSVLSGDVLGCASPLVLGVSVGQWSALASCECCLGTALKGGGGHAETAARSRAPVKFQGQCADSNRRAPPLLPPDHLTRRASSVTLGAVGADDYAADDPRYRAGDGYALMGQVRAPLELQGSVQFRDADGSYQPITLGLTVATSKRQQLTLRHQFWFVRLRLLLTEDRESSQAPEKTLPPADFVPGPRWQSQRDVSAS